MKVEDCKVQTSVQQINLVDKKMRDRSFRVEKYLVVLEDNTYFEDGERVKVVNNNDFDKLGTILKDLREDKKLLQQQVLVLEDIKANNEKRITSLELKLQRTDNGSSKLKDKILNIIN